MCDYDEVNDPEAWIKINLLRHEDVISDCMEL